MTMTAKAACKVTYTFVCRVCGNTHKQDFNVRMFEDFLGPDWPPGWEDILGLPSCGQHKVKGVIEIDGQAGEFTYPDGVWKPTEPAE